MARIDITGEIFGRLKVIDFAFIRKGKVSVWKCRCECGNVLNVIGSSLRTGNTKSCGCLAREWGRAGKARLLHGHARVNNASREYRTLMSMRYRCENPKCERWNIYGGRGIKVCERWMVFENFLADMGKHPGKGYSIDRIDSDGDYEPGNCRWATSKEQAHTNRGVFKKGRATWNKRKQ